MKPRAKKVPLFQSEAALCDAFMAWARARGWTPYPETAGWDVLVVIEGGLQIGVQAKLRFNLKVLAQTFPRLEPGFYANEHGPNYRAILVPDTADCLWLAESLGLLVFRPGSEWERRHLGRFGRESTDDWTMPGAFSGYPGPGEESRLARIFDWNPEKQHELPEFVPDVPAGVSGPAQLTPWKIAALRALAILEIDGHITRREIMKLGMDARRWCSGDGWLVPAGRPGVWARGETLPRFEKQHPDVFAKVLAEARAARKAAA